MEEVKSKMALMSAIFDFVTPAGGTSSGVT